MPNLWIPTDDPWQFQHIPFCREPSEMERFEKAGKKQLIKNMQFWPHHSEVELLTTKNQKRALHVLQNFYQCLSLWLEFYELGKHELLSELVLVPERLEIKPFADLSVATLRFAEQVHDKVEWAKRFPSREHVWILCEWAGCRQRIRAANLFGTAGIDKKGRLKGKTATHSDNMQCIERLKSILKYRDFLAAELESEGPCKQDKYDLKHYFTGRLVYEALETVVKKDDEDLESCIKQYLETWSHHLTLTKESEAYQIIYLVSPDEEPRMTEKNKKMSKPRGFVAKRSRGRPPKNSSVKKY